MKKRFWIILIIVAALVVCGIVYHNAISENETPKLEENTPVNEEKKETPVPVQTEEPEKSLPIQTAEPEEEFLQIPIEAVQGITHQEAEELCYSVMGEKDEETGFAFSFGTASAVERNGKQYYVIRASWLVNNSHLSYIGDFFVSADGNEVYSGVALPDEYTMGKLIWSK